MTDPRTCGDCGARPGEIHADGCDVARCLATGDQRIQCCEDHDCGREAWSGAWPGVAECEEWDWWAFESEATQKWMRENGILDGDRPHHNLNRLPFGADWDPVACRWRRPGDPVDDTAYVHWHLDRGLALQPATYTMDGASVRYPEEWTP